MSDQEEQFKAPVPILWALRGTRARVIPRWEYHATTGFLFVFLLAAVQHVYSDAPALVDTALFLGQWIAGLVAVASILRGVLGWAMCKAASVQHMTYYAEVFQQREDAASTWGTQSIPLTEIQEEES